MSYRQQLRRDRAARVLDRQLGAPMRRIRPGEEVEAAAGEVFEVIVDNDEMPGVVVAGRIVANGGGTLRIDPALRAVGGVPVVARETEAGELLGVVAVDDQLRKITADSGRGPIPECPDCEQLT